MFKFYKDKEDFLQLNKNIFNKNISFYSKINRRNYLFRFYEDNKEFFILSIDGRIYTEDKGYNNYDEIINVLLSFNLELKGLKDNNLLDSYNKRMVNTKFVVFAGGCFWCSANAYYKTNGIKKVYSGFCGGSEFMPTYEDVKAQKTHHQETILIEYDYTKVSFERLLNIFFNTIDPFDSKGQFIDRGHSYTTAIFTNDELEKEIVRKKINEVELETNMKVYLPIKRNNVFYMASEYHQDFHIKHPDLMEKELVESGRKK